MHELIVELFAVEYKIDLSERAHLESALIFSKAHELLLDAHLLSVQLAHLCLEFANKLVCVAQPGGLEVQGLHL